jgi:pyruvate dehydrogenase E1 component beta subunit
VVTYGAAVYTALQAAQELKGESISLEVIDLRSLVPLDRAAIFDSVRKTGRLVTLHDATRFAGFGAEIAAMVAEEAFEHLKGPVKRVAAPDIPVPFSPPLEDFYKPTAAQLVQAVRSLF